MIAISVMADKARRSAVRVIDLAAERARWFPEVSIRELLLVIPIVPPDIKEKEPPAATRIAAPMIKVAEVPAVTFIDVAAEREAYPEEAMFN